MKNGEIATSGHRYAFFLIILAKCRLHFYSVFADIIPNYALASTPSVSIIGGMGDTSKASTHPPGAPTFWLCTPSHR
ncbi:hypothetical protein, partial [Nitratifractor sp.]